MPLERGVIGRFRRGLPFQVKPLLAEFVQIGQARCVLDTKYKRAAAPAPDDIFQIVAYAEAKGCDQAVLIYPTPLARPLDERIGNIRVRTLTFALDGDLEQAGQDFIQKLTSPVISTRRGEIPKTVLYPEGEE